MASAVWKFPVAAADEQVITMPEGADVLAFDVQGGQAFVWALVDPDAPVVNRQFRVAGTGHPIENPERLRHIGTTQMYGGNLVWHLFEIVPHTKGQDEGRCPTCPTCGRRRIEDGCRNPKCREGKSPISDGRFNVEWENCSYIDCPWGDRGYYGCRDSFHTRSDGLREAIRAEARRIQEEKDR